MENIIAEEILCKVKEMEIETFQIESEKKKVESEFMSWILSQFLKFLNDER